MQRALGQVRESSVLTRAVAAGPQPECRPAASPWRLIRATVPQGEHNSSVSAGG